MLEFPPQPFAHTNALEKTRPSDREAALVGSSELDLTPGKAADGTAANPRKNPPKKRRKWLKRLLIWTPVSLLGLFLLLAVVLLFAGDKVLASLWPTIDKKLSAKGIYVEVGEFDQSGARGLILSELTLFKDSARKLPLLTLSDVAVKPRFFPKRVGLVGVELSFSDCVLQLITGDTDPSLQGTGGKILAGGKGVVVEEFATRHRGIELTVSGAMEWESLQGVGGNVSENEGSEPEAEPEDESVAESEPDSGSDVLDLRTVDLSPIDEIVRWMAVEEVGGRLQIGVSFSGTGDLPVSAELSVAGESIVWRGVPLRALDLGVGIDLAGGKPHAELRSLHVGYLDGDLKGKGAYDLGGQRVDLSEFQCDIDLIKLIGEIYPPAAKGLALVSYPAPPEWSFSGSVNLAERGESDLTGRIELPAGLSVGQGEGATAISELSVDIHFVGDEIQATALRVGYCGGLFVASAAVQPFAKPIALTGEIRSEKPLSIAMLSEVLGDPSTSKDELSLAGTWAGDLEKLKISKLEIGHGERGLRGEADLDLKGSAVEIVSLKSDLNLLGLLAELMPSLRESLAVVSESDGPKLEVKGRLEYANIAASDLTVEIRSGEGCVLDLGREPLAMDEIHATIVLRDGNISTDDLKLDLLGGSIEMKAAVRPFDEKFAMHGEIATVTGLPLSSLSRFLGEPSDSDELLTLDAEWAGGLEKIEISKLMIGQGEKRLDAVVDLDLAGEVARVEKLESNLDLIDLARGLVPAAAEGLSVFTSASGPELNVSGSVALADPTASDLFVKIASTEGFVLDLGGKPLTLSALSSTVEMKGGTVSTSDFSVDTLGGRVTADVAARPFDEELPFQVGLLIDRLVLQQLADLIGSEEEMPGTASMNYGGHGSVSFSDYNGEGTLDIADAEFYAFPLFGKVFGAINSLNFGIRKGEKGFARGPFSIKDGVITTDGIDLLAASMSIKIPGTVDLVKGRLDLKVNVKQTGIVGLAANVTAGSVDVDVIGPMAEPEVKVGLSGGIAGTTLDLAGDTLGVAGEMAGDVAGAAMDIIPGVDPASTVDPETKTEKKSEKKGFFSRWKKKE